MRGRNELISRIVFAACAGLVIVVMAALFIFVGSNAYQTFTVNHISLKDFFLSAHWLPDNGQVGVLVLIVGTFVTTVLAVLVATPISVGIALFVTQVAPPWARGIMQPVLELLTGIPSIIYGFLGLLVLVPLVQVVYDYTVGAYATTGFGIIAAVLVLSVMILPTITTISIDALASLPNGLREASLALGATRWQTIRKTLVPAASSGIFTGVILGTGRAIGETLAVSYVIGGNVNNFPLKLSNFGPLIQFPPTSTITVQLLFDFQEASAGTLNYNAIWTLAFVLLIISFLLVVASRWIASRSALNVRSDSPRSGRSLLDRISGSSLFSRLYGRPPSEDTADIAKAGAK
ncbi:MAG TPA: phosphate ABC transporter permease subunit PstC [Ktedonobacterales bacterium]|nr:phosphate ABC transporter permease subunit PstC [Ktedonobacterales bacterium]